MASQDTTTTGTEPTAPTATEPNGAATETLAIPADSPKKVPVVCVL
jgi:hypothetical protein